MMKKNFETKNVQKDIFVRVCMYVCVFLIQIII